MQFKTIVILSVLFLFAVFVIQNLTSVTVNFLIFELTMPRALLLVLCLVIGVLVGLVLPFEFKKKNPES